MFTGDLCGVPSQFFRHISSAFVDLLGYFTQAFSRIYPCFDFYSIRQCHSTHVSLLSAGCDRNYYTAYCRGERHPITTFLPLKCYLHFCNQPAICAYYTVSTVQRKGQFPYGAKKSAPASPHVPMRSGIGAPSLLHFSMQSRCRSVSRFSSVTVTTRTRGCAATRRRKALSACCKTPYTGFSPSSAASTAA